MAKVTATQRDIDRGHTGHMATWNHVVFETHEGGPDQSRRRMSCSVWAARGPPCSGLLHEVDDGDGSDCRRSLAGLFVGLCPPNRLQYAGVPGRLRSQYGASNCGF